jgi:hypothetical protein
MFMHDRPLIANLAQANRQTEFKFDFFPFSTPAHRIRDATNATSVPAVMSMSSISKITGSPDQEKNLSQVSRYAWMPFDAIGGGTSNIKTSA